MLHLTINTRCDSRYNGAVPVMRTHEGTLEDVMQLVAAAIINAKCAGVMETGGAIEIVIQNARVKVAGIPGRST